MAIIVKDLTVVRGRNVLLEKLNFVLSGGQIMLIKGRNGIGKTSLLRTVSGLQSPVKGEISVTENEIALQSHSDSIKLNLTVAENLEFWSRFYKTRNAELALQLFDLRLFKSRIAGNLSSGQKRKLALARLVALGRKIWLMDEPTFFLDQQSLQEFKDMIRKHLRSGGSVLMTTHDNFELGSKELVLNLNDFESKDKNLTVNWEAFL